MAEIRPMTAADQETVLRMMRPFYASEAVMTNGSEEIFRRDLEACTGPSPYAEGFLLLEEGQIAGYAMIARSFSTEFGRSCIWIEDLYLEPEHRGKGLGSGFLRFLRRREPEAVLRLEAERENRRAIAVYEGCGFSELPYLEMIQHPTKEEKGTRP